MLRPQGRSTPNHSTRGNAVPNEIKVLSTTAMKTSLDELAPEFQRATGNTLSLAFGPSARIAKMVADGEPHDVAIVTDQGHDDLTAQGKLVPGIRADIARSAMALAVQKGAPKPDISSAEKFKAGAAGGEVARHEQPGRRRPERRQSRQDFRQARHRRGDEGEDAFTARAARPD